MLRGSQVSDDAKGVHIREVALIHLVAITRSLENIHLTGPLPDFSNLRKFESH